MSQASQPRRSGAWFAAALLAVLAGALTLRLVALDEKLLHHDEGMNGWISLQLLWRGSYRYDPTDYHGPLLFYADRIALLLLGTSETALRTPTALAGGLLALLLLPLRRLLGDAGLLTAALLLAVAPGMVYFSRTAIHETFLVAGSALWAAGLLRFLGEPRPRWAALAALGALVCFVSKETAVLTAASLAAGLGLSWLAGRREQGDLFGGRTRGQALRAWTLGARASWCCGALLFAAGIALFYSSFFSHWRGVLDFFAGFGPWLEYGASGRNQAKPFGTFWSLLASTQGPARWLALGAGALALATRQRLGLLLAGWAASAWLLYSLIPYKTPWCALQIDLPCFLSVGWAAGLAWRSRWRGVSPRVARGLAWGCVVACLAPAPLLLRNSAEDIRERYDDFRRPYVYYQTYREYRELLQDVLGVLQLARAAGEPLRILNVGQDSPLRWYTLTRGFPDDHTEYVEEGPIPAAAAQADLIVSDSRFDAAIDASLGADGDRIKRRYYARPGIYAFVWVREALWQRYQSAGGRAISPWPRPPATARPRDDSRPST